MPANRLSLAHLASHEKSRSLRTFSSRLGHERRVVAQTARASKDAGRRVIADEGFLDPLGRSRASARRSRATPRPGGSTEEQWPPWWSARPAPATDGDD